MLSHNNNIFCIVGLGNPGEKYKKTRHNAGFLFLDYLSEEFLFSWEHKKYFAFSKQNLLNATIIFLKPMQYMNLSGFAVKEITQFYKISHQNLLVCYDEMSFKVGDYRLKPQGSAGGHNGMESIIQQLGGALIPRLRIGIAPMVSGLHSLDIKQYVLGTFLKEEQKILEEEVFKQGKFIIESFIQKGLEKTMSLVNQR